MMGEFYEARSRWNSSQNGKAKNFVNTLIFIGVFVVALLALIGLVLLVRSEASAQAKRQGAAQRATPAPTPAEPNNAEVQRPPSPERQGQQEPQRGAMTQEVPVEEQKTVSLNSQITEIVHELLALHQQARDFEDRLDVLTTKVTQIQRMRNGHLRIKEEYPQVAAPAESSVDSSSTPL